ncbi:MAG: NADH-ubiquinone oxidoreductase-F iron-sulfur binding region domain-containing protein [Myxococcota bacterium]
MNVVRIGMGSCGLAAGAQSVWTKTEAWLSEHGIVAGLREVGCSGLCHREVMLEIEEAGRPSLLYGDVTPENVAGILSGHFLQRRPVEARLIGTDGRLQSALHGQTRIASRNCGRIDPSSLEDYLARGGFRALEQAFDMGAAAVRRLVERSGLRGRGGGGFPTGRKWELAASSPDPVRFVICNADEGDPGAFMDRNLVESDPFSVIEGLIIAGLSIGAQRGYVYVRHEYPNALARMQQAILEARFRGLLGRDVAGRGWDFDVEIRRGAGAFVCGEETALIASIEGHRGLPVLRPPFPTEQGLFGHPTCINNVETLATVPWIVEHGVDAFRAHGTASSPGTKVFCLAGDIRRGGMVEVPMGVSLRYVLEDLGGGGERPLKAVQIGGPSGGCIPAELWDTPIDYEALSGLGAMLGSGGLVAMHEGRCMVDVARFFMTFMAQESCGKCTACREGTVRLAEILERICQGGGEQEDLQLLERLSGHVEAASLCGLGRSASNPLRSTLRYFRSEYEAHIHEGRCPAGTCHALIRYSIDAPNCDGCQECLRACPADAIHRQPRVIPLLIDDEACIRCNACREACPFDAVKVFS